MKLSKYLYVVLLVVGIAAMGTLTAPKLAAALEAAYVEIAIPNHPYYSRTDLFSGVPTTGPDRGTLGVTSITLSNFDANPQQIFIFQPIMSGGGCGVGTAVGGSDPSIVFWVQGKSTQHFDFPSPLTFSGNGGHTCVGGEITTAHTGSVEMAINGFVN